MKISKTGTTIQIRDLDRDLENKNVNLYQGTNKISLTDRKVSERSVSFPFTLLEYEIKDTNKLSVKVSGKGKYTKKGAGRPKLPDSEKSHDIYLRGSIDLKKFLSKEFGGKILLEKVLKEKGKTFLINILKST